MATKKFLAGFLALMVTMELVMTTALAAVSFTMKLIAIANG